MVVSIGGGGGVSETLTPTAQAISDFGELQLWWRPRLLQWCSGDGGGRSWGRDL